MNRKETYLLVLNEAEAVALVQALRVAHLELSRERERAARTEPKLAPVYGGQADVARAAGNRISQQLKGRNPNAKKML